MKLGRAGLLLAVGGLVACGTLPGETPTGLYRMRVTATMDDGSALPDEAHSLCLDLRGLSPDPNCRAGHSFRIGVEALDTKGNRDTTFNGFARITVRPGTVFEVQGEGGTEYGRNVLLKNGIAENELVHVMGAFGPARIVAEDIGYVPADPANTSHKPACANGLDDDGDGLVDFPADPGCEYANDDTETGGSHAAGVTPTLWYKYPTISDVQGYGPTTPFESESVVAETRTEQGVNVIVTKLEAQAFVVADVAPDTDPNGNPIFKTKPYGGLYVFNFGLPIGIRVCDRVTFLAGSMSQFFGFTEMNFPSYDVHPWDFRPVSEGGDGPCQVPEPVPLTLDQFASGPSKLPFSLESVLVRLREQIDPTGKPIMLPHVANHFGPGHPCANDACDQFMFDRDHSNCDLDDSGATDFEKDTNEIACNTACYMDPECSEWLTFRSRGDFRLILDPAQQNYQETIQVNAGAVANFDAREWVGQVIPNITGTLRYFSGGEFKWTIEPRCTEDMVFCDPTDVACQQNPPLPSGDPCNVDTDCVKPLTCDPDTKKCSPACVRPRTAADVTDTAN